MICSAFFSLFHCATELMKPLSDAARASSVSGAAAQKSCCSFAVHFVTLADLQQRQLIRDLAVVVVSRLLQEASGKIRELLLLGTLVACCCRLGPAYGGICFHQLIQTAFVGYLLVVDYLCILSSADCWWSSVKHLFDECLRSGCITGGQECRSQSPGNRGS